MMRTLGSTSVPVSPLGLGGAGIGNLYRAIDDETAQATVRCALRVGINFIDTAPHYGFGLSERRIGTVIREHSGQRVVLSTKVGRVLVPLNRNDIGGPRHGFVSPEPFEPKFDYSHDGVMRSFESSLERLGVTRIDVLLCHDIGALTHADQHEARLLEFLEGGYQAMRRLREEGAVGAIGVGVNEWEVCADLVQRCDLDCLLLAGRYTLLEQAPLHTLFPVCRERGVSVIIGGPFNSGILAADSIQAGAPYNYQAAPPSVLKRATRIASICRELDVPLQAAALQFPLAHPQVAAVVAGCSSAGEVERAAEWMQHPISPELWRALRDADLLHPAAPVPA